MNFCTDTYIVYLGLGHQGVNALKKYWHIKDILKNYKNINLHILGLVDVNKEILDSTYDEVKDWIEDKNNFIIAKHINDFFESFENQSINLNGPILFYDATPSVVHKENISGIKGHLDEFKKNGKLKEELENHLKFYYFGEKPLLIDEEDLNLLLSTPEIPIWIDFIDLYSDTYLNLLKFINQENIKIKKIECYRASCISIDKIFSDERKGITGGSLEDKMIHDIALIFHLLSNNEYTKFFFENNNINFEDFIKEAKIIAFMPENIKVIFTNKPSFSTCYGTSSKVVGINRAMWPKKPGKTTADIAFILKTKWNDIEINFYSSWLGLYDFPNLSEIIDEIKENFIYEEWLLSDVIKKEEARVWHIQTLEGSSDTSIFCSFLNRGSIKQKVIYFPNYKGKKEIHFEISEFKSSDQIERIFIKVIENCVDIYNKGIKEETKEMYGDNLYISKYYADKVHRFIFKAKEKAFNQIFDISCELKKIKSRFLYYINF